MIIRTDEQVKKDIVDELYWDTEVNASDVNVTVSDGEVTLTGTVPSYSDRGAAALDAWGIEGVKEVSNEITVSFPSTFTVPTDTQIKSNAENTLLWNPSIYSDDIDVAVTAGLVTLEGTVDAYWKKLKAEDLVSDLSGVIDVENHLAVVPTTSFVDKDIATDIEDALERNLYIDGENVTVKVENGEVTLTGTVPTYYSRRRVEDAAGNTAGVIDVHNYVVVSA